MSDLGQWAASWLDRLIRDPGPRGPHPSRGLVLHDSMWGAIEPHQVTERLRLLRVPSSGADKRQGMCAVVYEAPWQGRPALWIEAADYHNGDRRQGITLVRPRDGRGPAVPAPRTGSHGGAGSMPNLPTTRAAVPGPLPSRSALPTLRMPYFTTRGMFWLSFLLIFLLFLWPLVLVFVVIDFRRAEALGRNGGAYVRAAVTGALAGCGVGAVLCVLLWVTVVSSLG